SWISEEAGMCMVLDHKLRHVHMFNHMEYDSTTIGDEYQRDVAKGDDIQLPANYYPDDDPSKVPINTWRGNGHLLFGNWLNYVYQTTHYDLEEIGTDREGI
ncbi:MAG: homoserine O-succinyltransferase, partial [Alphaproteobacteria bacterium]|nr:homoserine O-succinyltransferase [Alphaproteobacteria bacterium]